MTGAATCRSCHCALAAAVAPRLIAAGVLTQTELFAASALNRLTDTIRDCSREWSLQMLASNDELRLSQLLALDTCAVDVPALAQCGSVPTTTANASSTAVPSLTAPGGVSELVRDASCALAASTNSSTATGGCDDATPMTVAGWLAGFMAPPRAAGTGANTQQRNAGGSDLRITTRTARGPVSWRAGCWCQGGADPVCDPVTRVQYHSPCAAACQVWLLCT